MKRAAAGESFHLVEVTQTPHQTLQAGRSTLGWRLHQHSSDPLHADVDEESERGAQVLLLAAGHLSPVPVPLQVSEGEVDDLRVYGLLQGLEQEDEPPDGGGLAGPQVPLYGVLVQDGLRQAHIYIPHSYQILLLAHYICFYGCDM